MDAWPVRPEQGYFGDVKQSGDGTSEMK